MITPTPSEIFDETFCKGEGRDRTVSALLAAYNMSLDQTELMFEQLYNGEPVNITYHSVKAYRESNQPIDIYYASTQPKENDNE